MSTHHAQKNIQLCITSRQLCAAVHENQFTRCSDILLSYDIEVKSFTYIQFGLCEKQCHLLVITVSYKFSFCEKVLWNNVYSQVHIISFQFVTFHYDFHTFTLFHTLLNVITGKHCNIEPL